HSSGGSRGLPDVVRADTSKGKSPPPARQRRSGAVNASLDAWDRARDTSVRDESPNGRAGKPPVCRELPDGNLTDAQSSRSAARGEQEPPSPFVAEAWAMKPQRLCQSCAF